MFLSNYLILMIRKLINKFFPKRFVIDFSFSDIDEKKILSNKEYFEEFLKMFKNDYIERLRSKDYNWAEVIKGIIERLVAMYSNYHQEEFESKKSNTKTVDIITKLQEKMKDEWKNIWQ